MNLLPHHAAELIVIVARETVSPERRWMAGLPEVQDLEAELRRRENMGRTVTR